MSIIWLRPDEIVAKTDFAAGMPAMDLRSGYDLSRRIVDES
jgi:hypothetical protein